MIGDVGYMTSGRSCDRGCRSHDPVGDHVIGDVDHMTNSIRQTKSTKHPNGDGIYTKN